MRLRPIWTVPSNVGDDRWAATTPLSAPARNPAITRCRVIAFVMVLVTVL
jgi:hypothetical protein